VVFCDGKNVTGFRPRPHWVKLMMVHQSS